MYVPPELALLEWMLAYTIPSFYGKPESLAVWKKAFNNWMKNANTPPASQVFYLIGDMSCGHPWLARIMKSAGDC